MKVVVLGLRSIPAVAGGIETHCEQLYPRIARVGVDVEIIVRSPYGTTPTGASWNGVRIRRFWSPKRAGFETFFHTLIGVVYAGIARPDLLHLHAVGPGLFAPLARAFGLKVIVTHHGSDYERAKWGPFAKRLLKTGERLAMYFANEVISVSRSKGNELTAEYGREPIVIPNGVPVIERPTSLEVLEEFGLEAHKYVLHVGRWTPEKRQDDLIEGFVKARLSGWRLVLVGDMTGEDQFSRRVRRMAEQHETVVLAGFRSGDALRALFTNAGCFALPSTIEGFSIALLEALSAGCAVVASDIPANHEIELPAGCYFPVGDIDAMSDALAAAARNRSHDTWMQLRKIVHAEYDWERIAERTVRVYRNTIAQSPGLFSTDEQIDSRYERVRQSHERTSHRAD